MNDFGHQAFKAWSEIRFKEQAVELIHAVGINVSDETDPNLVKQLNGALDDIHGL
jgi:hypothetical protein